MPSVIYTLQHDDPHSWKPSCWEREVIGHKLPLECIVGEGERPESVTETLNNQNKSSQKRALRLDCLIPVSCVQVFDLQMVTTLRLSITMERDRGVTQQSEHDQPKLISMDFSITPWVSSFYSFASNGCKSLPSVWGFALNLR